MEPNNLLMNFLIIGKMRKIFIPFLAIIFISCHRDSLEFDRTYRLTNGLNMTLRIETKDVSDKLTRTLSIDGRGIIIEETNLAVDGDIHPSKVLGHEIIIFFNDSLVITHKTGFLDTSRYDPPNENVNILYNESWNRVSNERYTYEINEELLSQAVPLED
jgi:hypothetical protein